MIRDEFGRIRGNTREWRNFGVVMGTVSAIIGGILYVKGSGRYSAPFAVSVFMLSSAVLVPKILKPLHKAWMSLSIVIGYVMTRVLLCALFFLLLTPLGLLARLANKEFLKKTFREPCESYWLQKEERAGNSYEKQY